MSWEYQTSIIDGYRLQWSNSLCKSPTMGNLPTWLPKSQYCRILNKMISRHSKSIKREGQDRPCLTDLGAKTSLSQLKALLYPVLWPRILKSWPLLLLRRVSTAILASIQVSQSLSLAKASTISSWIQIWDKFQKIALWSMTAWTISQTKWQTRSMEASL